MNIYESLTQWLTNNYSDINDWVYFNAEKHEDGNTSVMSSESSTIEEYIDGSKLITLPFTISMIKRYDFEQSDTNLTSMSEAQNFIEWLCEQNNIGNYPDLGNCVIEELAVTNLAPTVLVNTAENLAKYSVNCVIKYIQKG